MVSYILYITKHRIIIQFYCIFLQIQEIYCFKGFQFIVGFKIIDYLLKSSKKLQFYDHFTAHCLHIYASDDDH